MTNDNIYLKLREYMDSLSSGFPATDTGVEIKILKKLFTTEQAELTLQLKEEPEAVATIAGRVGMAEADLAEKLEEMAKKGIIFRVRKDGKPLYRAYQFLIGLYEFQVNNIDKEFAELFEEYLIYIGMSWADLKTGQTRIMPIESSITSISGVATYNQVREIIEQADSVAVGQCICRKEQELLGNPCDYPQEVCMAVNEYADYFIENQLFRPVSKKEAFDNLEKSEEAGLVLIPSNSQKVEFICNCCSCCCPTLRFAKMAPRPADELTTYFEAKIDPEECTACEECQERCQMDAIELTDGVSEIIDGRCIGCGVCIPTCPTEAISLVAISDPGIPPGNFDETHQMIKSQRMNI